MKEIQNMLVLKVGTSTIVDGKANYLEHASFQRIGQQINELRTAGHGVVVVSSAARKRLPHVGWNGVLRAWSEAVDEDVHSFLLTEQELDVDGGCNHITTTVRAGRIAIANADDDRLREDRYRSNDLVGARLGVHAVRAGFKKVQYGMLSDVHGVYADINDPTSVMSTADVGLHRHLAGGVGSEGATGGMATKFDAAVMTTSAGIRTWVAHGRESSIALAIAGLEGTTFNCTQQQIGVSQ